MNCATPNTNISLDVESSLDTESRDEVRDETEIRNPKQIRISKFQCSKSFFRILFICI